MGLDEDAGLFFVSLAQLFAGKDRRVDLLFEVGGSGDARAVGAGPQKPARGWPRAEKSRGCRSHSMAMVSISASVYLPAPAGRRG